MTDVLDGDRFIAEQLQGRLSADEFIVHTAYLETDSGAGVMGGLRRRAYWAALTPTRLLLIEARVGAFKPLLENKGVEIIERASITGASARGATLTLALADGRRLAFVAQRARKEVSGQASFIDELVTRHGSGPEAATLTKDLRNKRALGVVVAVLAVGYGAYQLFYASRAEVSVQCTADPTGVQCTATHTTGGAKAKACWQVELSCKDGTRHVAPACTVVEPGKTSTVTVTEQSFSGHAMCDETLKLDVTSLRLD